VSQREFFGGLAARYDELRPASTDGALGDAIVREGDFAGKSILDVGCGTGRDLVPLRERAGCRVAGVDPSPEMLEQARAKLPACDLRLGTAEKLPFADAIFEGAQMVNLAHHVDPPAAFSEARRVLVDGARLVSANMHPDGSRSWWAARFFPSCVELERRRFPHPEALVAELQAAGFRSSWWLPLPLPRRFSRAEGLSRLRGRAYSTLDLLEEDEYRAGVAFAERELPPIVEYVLEWSIVVGER
jgi:ubiquinone/menaquinone biosynthesis C-methylase UbiE